MRFHKTYRKDFEWKFQAQNFVSSLKRVAKQNKWKVEIKTIPIYRFISSTAQKKQWWRSDIPAERRIAGYCVKWEYLP